MKANTNIHNFSITYLMFIRGYNVTHFIWMLSMYRHNIVRLSYAHHLPFDDECGGGDIYEHATMILFYYKGSLPITEVNKRVAYIQATDWCFRKRLYTVRLCWAWDNLG